MEFDKNKIDQKLLFMDTCLNKLKKLRTLDKNIFIYDFERFITNIAKVIV
ncbi:MULTISPECIES: hypothetical protein [Clostridium]|nr:MULTISPECIES: hypothetical protein [Clostridium]